MRVGARAPLVTSRELLFVLALGGWGAPGLLAGSRGVPDPLGALAWVSLIAPAGGYAAGARGVRLWPLAPVVPVIWMAIVGAADGFSERDLPALAWAALAVAGLFAIGFALPAAVGEFPWRGVGALLLLAGGLALLSLPGLVLRSAFPPRIAAHLLDVSPVTLAAECAGVDWMRHPPVYEGSATVDIDPTLRSPYRGEVAGAWVLGVGCAGAVWGARRRQRRSVTEGLAR